MSYRSEIYRLSLELEVLFCYPLQIICLLKKIWKLHPQE